VPGYMIETSNLSKIYHKGGGDIRALDGVDVEVADGEFLTILGPSGSGKTTLLYMMGALDRPTSGTVILDGSDLSKLSETELVRLRRQKVGFVFQQYNLLPTFSAMENVEATLAPTGMDR